MPTEQRVADIAETLAFLVHLEADKGEDYVYGGRRLGDVIQAFCRLIDMDPVRARNAILNPEGRVN